MNEILMLLTAVLCTGAILVTWRLGRSRLYCLILIFLILIAAAGGKVVTFFGHETNTGNIFYAAAYLATYFLLERYGRRAGFYAVWIGALGVAFYSLLVYITIQLAGSPETSALNSALPIVFEPVPRVAFASILAFVISQNVNIRLYLHLKAGLLGASRWWRANIANALAQMLDSLVFFVIAFAGVVPNVNVGDILFTGLAIKVAYMAITAPFLYLNGMELDEDGDGVSVVTVG